VLRALLRHADHRQAGHRHRGRVSHQRANN
jgi:hypothetical protein